MNESRFRPIDYRSPETTSRTSQKSVRTLIVVLIVVAIGLCVFVFMPSADRAREPARVIKYPANLRRIGEALLVYAKKSDNRYPDRIEKALWEDSGDRSLHLSEQCRGAC